MNYLNLKKTTVVAVAIILTIATIAIVLILARRQNQPTNQTDQTTTITKKLPYSTEHYVILPPNQQGVIMVNLLISFNAGVNGPPIDEQKRVFNQTVDQYKQEVFGWFKNQDVNPQQLKIVFQPNKVE